VAEVALEPAAREQLQHSRRLVRRDRDAVAAAELLQRAAKDSRPDGVVVKRGADRRASEQERPELPLDLARRRVVGGDSSRDHAEVRTRRAPLRLREEREQTGEGEAPDALFDRSAARGPNLPDARTHRGRERVEEVREPQLEARRHEVSVEVVMDHVREEIVVALVRLPVPIDGVAAQVGVASILLLHRRHALADGVDQGGERRVAGRRALVQVRQLRERSRLPRVRHQVARVDDRVEAAIECSREAIGKGGVSGRGAGESPAGHRRTALRIPFLLFDRLGALGLGQPESKRRCHRAALAVARDGDLDGVGRGSHGRLQEIEERLTVCEAAAGADLVRHHAEESKMRQAAPSRSGLVDRTQELDRRGRPPRCGQLVEPCGPRALGACLGELHE
jgi:hypothetical protein